jgi:hypothetical protein
MEREPKIFARKTAYLSREVLEEMCDCIVFHPHGIDFYFGDIYSES